MLTLRFGGVPTGSIQADDRSARAMARPACSGVVTLVSEEQWGDVGKDLAKPSATAVGMSPAHERLGDGKLELSDRWSVETLSLRAVSAPPRQTAAG